MNCVFEHSNTYSFCFSLCWCLDALDLNIRLSIALLLAKELEEALIRRVYSLAMSLYFYVHVLFKILCNELCV